MWIMSGFTSSRDPACRSQVTDSRHHAGLRASRAKAGPRTRGSDAKCAVLPRHCGKFSAQAIRILERDGLGSQIDIAHADRDDLNSRQSNGRLVRKALSHSRRKDYLQHHIDFEDAIYNLVRPHSSLRLRLRRPAAHGRPAFRSKVPSLPRTGRRRTPPDRHPRHNRQSWYFASPNPSTG